MSFDEFEKQLDDMEKHVKNDFEDSTVKTNDEPQEESDDDENEFYCVACTKSFKSEKA